MGETVQLTYTAVGRGLVAAPVVNFPQEMKFPVQESPAQDIHFNPTFSPVFSPNLPELNVEIKVEPTPITMQVTVPELPIVVNVPEQSVVVHNSITIKWWVVASILFANSAFIAILLFALNYYFYEFEWPSSLTISN